MNRRELVKGVLLLPVVVSSGMPNPIVNYAVPLPAQRAEFPDDEHTKYSTHWEEHRGTFGQEGT